MYYSERYNGYIADVAELDFIRCDGKVFHYDEANNTSTTATNNTITITGGWGSYPLAFIDTDKTFEITFESSQFSLEMFEMAQATNIVTGDKGIFETARFEVETGRKITLPFEVKSGTVKIRGLEEASTLDADKFTVAITEAGAETAGSTVVTFNEGDVAVGDTIRISYRRRGVNVAVVADTATSGTARGELWLHYPVYSAGIDCTEASMKGRVHEHLYRVRATQIPSTSGSYKSAATFSVTFAALNPHRPDNKIRETIYEEFDADGNIITTSSNGSVDWN